MNETIWLDGTLYPETEPPSGLTDVLDRADFLARLCAAWDFGVLPYPETVVEICKSGWRDAVEKCRLLTSPSYHLLRDWHRLPPLPYLGRRLACIADDPNLDYV